METITIEDMDEDSFRHSVEDLLRYDRTEEAIALLRELLEPYVRQSRILPERMLEITAQDIEFTGWARLAERLRNHDRPSFPISAIGVALADARTLGGPGPQGGRLAPFLKTFYFSDDAYPFTGATRDDLLDGYSREGFGWQGDYQATDATLSIRGIDDIHGAIIALEDRLLETSHPSAEEIRAGTIGACYLAVLIHHSLRETIRRQGLPRPLCVFAACDGVYPFFDAPVAGWDESEPAAATEDLPASADADDVWPSEIDEAVASGEPADSAAEGSLLSIVSRKGTKQLALAIGDEDRAEAERFTAEASASRLVMTDDSALRGLFHGIAAAPLAPLPVEPFDEAETAMPAQPVPEPETLAPRAFTAPAEPLAANRQAPDPAADWQDERPARQAAEPAALAQPGPADSATTVYTTYDPLDPRTRFLLAEQSGAFPTGRGLRQRLQADQPAPVRRATPRDWLAGQWARLGVPRAVQLWARRARRLLARRIRRHP